MRPRRASVLGTVVLTAILPLLASCGGGDDGSTDEQRTITVLAAAPLEPAFHTLATQFELDHPRTRVDLVYGPSLALAARLGQDSKAADVLVTADEDSMNAASDEVEGPVSFATARLVLAVGKPAWGTVRSARDLQAGRVPYVVCGDTAPCGRVGRELLQRAGVRRAPDGAIGDAPEVLAKVLDGTYDAGVVYAGQVRDLRDKVRVIALDGEPQRLNELFIAPVSLAPHPDLAQDWVDLVLGEKGRRALHAAGFLPPQG